MHFDNRNKKRNSWNKGKKNVYSKETLEKMSKVKKGIRPFGLSSLIEWQKKNGSWNKGKPAYKCTNETRKKMSLARKGKKMKESTKEKISGSKSYLWKGGITPMNEKIRHSLEYKIWRNTIFERDNYICKICRKRGGDMVADHIKPFSIYPNLRLEINNGRTLCENCHRLTETYGWKLQKYQFRDAGESGEEGSTAI